ncbi:MAG TPA: cobalamin-binding protein [Desulfotomaculum sp.]|nr:cobalamin-binding protein [Desulfotomaculum sp.]
MKYSWQISSAIQAGEVDRSRELVTRSLREGLAPGEILDKALMPGMEAVGEKFGGGEMFLPEVMLSASAFQAGLEALRPWLKADDASFRGKIVLGTVAGDIHDLGKNLVAAMFTANGFEVIDLGVNVPAERFVAAVEEHRPDLLGLSALLTTTMSRMPEVIRLLQKRGLHGDPCRVIIGGAPVNEEFAASIGADLYAENAIEAVRMVRRLLLRRKRGEAVAKVGAG